MPERKPPARHYQFNCDVFTQKNVNHTKLTKVSSAVFRYNLEMPRKRETLRLGSFRKIKVTDKKKLFEQNGFKLVLAVDRSFHLNIHLQLLTTHSLSHQLWNINKVHKVAVYPKYNNYTHYLQRCLLEYIQTVYIGMSL